VCPERLAISSADRVVVALGSRLELRVRRGQNPKLLDAVPATERGDVQLDVRGTTVGKPGQIATRRS
jgi:hypothetical protein